MRSRFDDKTKKHFNDRRADSSWIRVHIVRPRGECVPFILILEFASFSEIDLKNTLPDDWVWCERVECSAFNSLYNYRM